MFAKLLTPQVDFASLFLRWGLAAIFVVHGYVKVAQDLPLREEWTMTTQLLLGWTELVCGGLLAIGLFSRVAALAVIPLQVGAIWFITGKDALKGLEINRGGADYTRVGPEYNLVLIAMCLGVMLLGSGAISVDHFLLSWWRNRKPRTASAPEHAAAPAVAGAGSPP